MLEEVSIITFPCRCLVRQAEPEASEGLPDRQMRCSAPGLLAAPQSHCRASALPGARLWLQPSIARLQSPCTHLAGSKAPGALQRLCSRGGSYGCLQAFPALPVPVLRQHSGGGSCRPTATAGRTGCDRPRSGCPLAEQQRAFARGSRTARAVPRASYRRAMQSPCRSPVCSRSCALGTASKSQRPVGQIAWLESPWRYGLHLRCRVDVSAAAGTGANSQAPATALVDLLRTIKAGFSAGPPPAPAGASLDVRGLTFHPAGMPSLSLSACACLLSRIHKSAAPALRYPRAD